MHITAHKNGMIITSKIGDIAINTTSDTAFMTLMTTYTKPSDGIILGSNTYTLPGEYEKKSIPFQLIDCKNGCMIACIKLENKKIMILPDAIITNNHIKEIAEYGEIVLLPSLSHTTLDAIKPILETLQPQIIAFQTEQHTSVEKHFGELEHTHSLTIHETNTSSDKLSIYCLS